MLAQVTTRFAAAKRDYDRGVQAFTGCLETALCCLEALANADLRDYGDFAGQPPIPYRVAEHQGALSRPFRAEMFASDPAEFIELGQALVQAIERGDAAPAEMWDRVVYTAVTAFSLSFDLWKPGSRKTPGTYFEVLIGSAARVLFPHYTLSKHIPIRDLPIVQEADALVDDADVALALGAEEAVTGNSVSTDLVITNPATGRGAVIPLKITTRERIVQPFAHQRILDSACPGRYASFIACISEVQRDDKTQAVKQICVPGTVALFQKHLARVEGLYYCDIPRRYGQADFQQIIPVQSFHKLFEDVRAHLAE